MVRITEEMVRKRAEHNEGEIFSLEELSLHQLDIEKIEHIQNWCKKIQILYLQNNLISKIENVYKLKDLNYLNLALNNIEKIENLEACESLKKLDLTVNFVGEISSIESLKNNEFLEELYLVGNPCANYEGYKEYVIATLTQLKKLDGIDIERSERIKAIQNFPAVREKIKDQEAVYAIKRQEQINESKQKDKIIELDDEKELNEEEKQKKEEDYWKEKVDYTPESRSEMQNKIRENKEKTTPSRFTQKVEKRKRRLFNEHGEPVSVNEAKVDFLLTESDDDCNFILDVSCYKYLDTSLIDLDIQPWYARVTIKGKVLQIVLFEEVKPDSCTAKRSQVTGHLLVTLPKLYPPKVPAQRPKTQKAEKEGDEKRNFLEVREPQRSIVEQLDKLVTRDRSRKQKKNVESCVETYDDDHPEVPPLI